MNCQWLKTVEYNPQLEWTDNWWESCYYVHIKLCLNIWNHDSRFYLVVHIMFFYIAVIQNAFSIVDFKWYFLIKIHGCKLLFSGRIMCEVYWKWKLQLLIPRSRCKANVVCPYKEIFRHKNLASISLIHFLYGWFIRLKWCKL